MSDHGLGEREAESHQDGAVDEVLDLDARPGPHAEQVARLRPSLGVGDVVDAVLLDVEGLSDSASGQPGHSDQSGALQRSQSTLSSCQSTARHRRLAWNHERWFAWAPRRVVGGGMRRRENRMVTAVERVRLGVVGTGNIADMNVAGYLEHPRCDVVAVCDVDEATAKAAAERWGSPTVYTDLDRMLEDPDIDAVEILTPTHLHYEHVLASLKAGKHVSVQKPVTNSVGEARTLGEAATKAGLTLRISECFVHYPPLELAKKLVSEGAIGRPTAIRIKTVVGQTDSEFQANLRPEGYGWRLDSRSPGGHLFDDMVHKFAMAMWLVDQDITSVQAVVQRRDYFFEPCVACSSTRTPSFSG